MDRQKKILLQYLLKQYKEDETKKKVVALMVKDGFNKKDAEKKYDKEIDFIQRNYGNYEKLKPHQIKKILVGLWGK